MCTCNLETCLKYIRDNQRAVQAADAELLGPDALTDKENVYLPSSFLGSACWASEQIADSLMIAAQLGPATFFITITCNPHWPKITSQLRNGQKYSDVPIVVCRCWRNNYN